MSGTNARGSRLVMTLNVRHPVHRLTVPACSMTSSIMLKISEIRYATGTMNTAMIRPTAVIN